MVVGSVAASFHGHPRTTMDIDAVVEGDEETLRRFARSLGEGYYVDEEEIKQAVRSQRAFNIIDESSGYKADLIIRKNRPFSIEKWSKELGVWDLWQRLKSEVFPIGKGKKL